MKEGWEGGGKRSLSDGGEFEQGWKVWIKQSGADSLGAHGMPCRTTGNQVTRTRLCQGKPKKGALPGVKERTIWMQTHTKLSPNVPL